MSSINFSKILKLSARVPFSSIRNCHEDWFFDEVSGCVHMGEKKLTLRPKTAALLNILISNPDKVHSKQALLDEVWPDVVIQEQAIFQCINEIRKIFSSKACIKTWSGKGYQWIGLNTHSSQDLRNHARFNSVVILTSILLLLSIVSVSLYSNKHLAIDTVTLAILPIQSASKAAKDDGISLGFMQMVNNYSQQIRDVQLTDTKQVLSNINHPLNDTIAMEDLVHLANFLVQISIKREGETLNVKFTIKNAYGEIDGSYKSQSQVWLAQQVAYELHDAIHYSLAKKEASTDRIKRHQFLIAAKQQFYQGKLNSAQRLVQNAAADHRFLSAQFFSIWVDSKLDSSMPIELADHLLTETARMTDPLNQARTLLLAAQLSQRNGMHEKAMRYLDRGKNIATKHAFSSLVAAFDFNTGVTLATNGLNSQAIEAFNSAVSRYQDMSCYLSLISTYQKLANLYRDIGLIEKQKNILDKIQAINTLFPAVA